jgi:hypothetical protein
MIYASPENCFRPTVYVVISQETKMLTFHPQSTIKSAASRFKGLEVDEDVMASRLEAEINSSQGKGIMVVPFRVADRHVVERSKSKAKDFMPSAFRNIPFQRWLKQVIKVRSPNSC